MSYSKIGLSVAALTLSGQLLAAPAPSVIIQCDGNCDRAISSVEAAGGSVIYRYQFVDAIAATVPFRYYGRVGAMAGVSHVWKDIEIERPEAVESFSLDGDFEIAGPATELVPNDFLESVALTGVGPLFSLGFDGDGTNVIVIDTGTANVPAFNRAGCETPGPTVIGGQNFIAAAGATEPPATSPLNGPHGTQVGTSIAANAVFNIAPWNNIVATHSPSSVVRNDAGVILGIPMLGTAPCAQIYALKTFRAAGGGAPRSDIVAAMERAIEMRVNYNNGIPSVPVSGTGAPNDPFVYDSLRVDVVNMSLGGPTLFAGFEVTDQLTEKMLEVGITVINSAGNSGHAAMTGGSAGTGFGTLTAGAAALTHNERILRDLQFGAGIGALYRPAPHHQMATFSSRGPSPDGRINVDAVANGFAVFAMPATGTTVNLVSGTSFSAPTIAGAAATLRQAFPDARALQIRNALVETANPNFLGDDSGPIDQGHGFIDLPAAFQALANGQVSDRLPSGPGSNSVRGNIASAGFRTIQLGNSGYSRTIRDLMPGQVEHLFIQTTADTEALEIRFTNVNPELPPAEQNLLFGDDLFVVVQDAVTSTASTLASGFIFQDSTLVAANPQAGIVRVGVMGDWTNAGRISADIQIREIRGNSPRVSDRGRLSQGESRTLTVDVPPGTSQASFELRWQQDWGAYPTDDLDLIVLDPAGNLVIEFGPSGPFLPGATLNSPERVVINNPTAGEYTVILDGWTVWGERGARAQYSFHAFDQDGRALPTQGL